MTQDIAVEALTAYGGGSFNMATNTSGGFNSSLTDPQGGQGGASLQPGGPYSSSCVIGESALGGSNGNCWVWPLEEWVTVLIHVTPGHQSVSNDLADSQNPKDMGIEVWIARAGQTAYRRIWSKPDYVFYFESHYINGELMPYGWNWLNFSAYTGGAGQVASMKGYSHRHDQLIFSKDFIPCPKF